MGARALTLNFGSMAAVRHEKQSAGSIAGGDQMKGFLLLRHPFHLAFTWPGPSSPYSFEKFPLGPHISGPFFCLRYAFHAHYADGAMPSPEYSLIDILGRIYENQVVLEAALMDLTLLVESQGYAEVGDNLRGDLLTFGKIAAHIKQGLARLKARKPD